MDKVPPVVPADKKSGMNVFNSINTRIPLLNEKGKVVGYFAADYDHKCLVRMVSAVGK